jgi:hypothetical protein
MAEQPASGSGEENCASASVATPFSMAELLDFVQDVKRLFRLNPFLEIESFEGTGALAPGARFHMKALNEMNGLRLDQQITVAGVSRLGYCLNYDNGLKRATQIIIEPQGTGTRLTLKDYYHTPPLPEQEARLLEVDRSLVPWAAAVHAYLNGLHRWSWFWPYRKYKQGFWLSMPPRHRRIARLLIWTTILEFIVFLFVFAIYWLEGHGGR